MKRRAFTLLEIIVVVVIVGVLAGLSLPRLLRAMELQKVEVVKQQLQQIATAIQVTTSNNKQYDFCGKGSSPQCADTDDVNTALELDIHNQDFNFMVRYVSGWGIEVWRVNGPKFYTIDYDIDEDMEFICQDNPADGACAWINM